MNHIYRVVYNTTLACYQVVGELGKSKKKQRLSHANSASSQQTIFKLRPLSYSLTLALLGLISPNLFAAPQGGNVVAGNAEIQQQHNITNIQQASQRAVINWQGFDVAKQETVNFHQPNNQAVTLNRVIGQQKSVIDGAINANGHVFIQNEKGVLIGKEAQINVGGLVATTQQIDNDKFMQGQYQFSGNAQGTVENLGNIQVPKGGVVALIAPIVKNSGNITALNADVLLASAEQFRLTLPQDGFAYTLDRGTLEGLVENKGAIIADGGHIILTAKGVSAVKKSVINHSGLLQANTVVNKNGVIELLGDLDNSELHFSGTIKAEAPEQGDGGLVETSAAKLHISEKANVSTQAKNGKTGKWVIDPKDFVVAAIGGDMTGQQVSNALNSNDVELRSRSGAKEGRGDVIINDQISWARNTLTLNADADIRINQVLNGSGTAKLRLLYGQSTEYGEIPSTTNHNHYYGIHTTGPYKINLPVGQNYSTRSGYAGDETTYTIITTLPENGELSDNYLALGSNIDLSQSSVRSGWNWNVDGHKLFDGLGHTISGLQLNSNEDNIGLFRNINDVYITSIDFAAPNVKGGNNVGVLAGTISNAVIEGVNIENGHVQGRTAVGGIVGRMITTDNTIGDEYGSNIMNVSSEKGTVKGDLFVGGIVGMAVGKGDIDEAHSSGHIEAGKLTTSQSNPDPSSDTFFDNTISGMAGGIIGAIDAQSEAAGEFRIEDTTSSATVIAQDVAGGLIGATSGIVSVRDSYTTGNVNARSFVGGLVGEIDSPDKNDLPPNLGGGFSIDGQRVSGIETSYATGNINADLYAGGLVGLMKGGMIRHAYSKGTITLNQPSYVGGIVGKAYSSYIIGTYTTSQINAPIDADIGGIVGFSERTYGNFGIYDRDKIHATVENSGQPKTADEMKQRATYEEFFSFDEPIESFDKIWEMNNNSYPRLKHRNDEEDSAFTHAIPDAKPNEPILDIDNPLPSSNVQKTGDIVVRYTNSKYGFQIIPASQHLQLQVTYTDKNGQTHRFTTKEGADLFWFFSNGENKDSSLARENGVVLLAPNVKEGSKIVVTGFNERSETMVREFDVNTLLGIVPPKKPDSTPSRPETKPTTPTTPSKPPQTNTGGKNSSGKNTTPPSTGNKNSGEKNTTPPSTGNKNSGGKNTTPPSTGNKNSGGKNTTPPSTGNKNSGGKNTTPPNTGNKNSGGKNTTPPSTGNKNSGVKNATTPSINNYGNNGSILLQPNINDIKNIGTVDLTSQFTNSYQSDYVRMLLNEEAKKNLNHLEESIKHLADTDYDLSQILPVIQTAGELFLETDTAILEMIKPEIRNQIIELGKILDSDVLTRNSHLVSAQNATIYLQNKKALLEKAGEKFSNQTNLGKTVQVLDKLMTLKQVYETSNKIMDAYGAYKDGKSIVGRTSDIVTDVASMFPLVGSAFSIYNASISLAQFFAKDSIDGSIKRDIEMVKNQVDTFLTTNEKLVTWLSEGKITKEQARKVFNKNSGDTISMLSKINDRLLIGDNTPTSEKISKYIFVILTGLTSNSALLDESQTKIEDAVHQVGTYKFETILSLAEAERISKGNFMEIK